MSDAHITVEQWNRQRRGTFIAFLILTVMNVAAFYVAANRTNEKREAAIDRAAFAQCERGNAVRAYLRSDASLNAKDPAGRRARADRVFPILDCAATVKMSESVPASPAAQEAYITALNAKADGR